MSISKNIENLLDEAKVYESVLENMPHDEFALKRLVEIYSQCEDQVKIREFDHRLQHAQEGELDIDSFYDHTKEQPKSKFFTQKSKINDLISLCKSEEEQYFTSHIDLWTQIRPHIDLLIRFREWGMLDVSTYVDLCNHLIQSRNKDNPSIWRGIVSYLPDCDRVKYLDLLEALKSRSGLQYVDLSEFHYSNELELLPKKLISYAELLIFSVTKAEVSVAMLNPFNQGLKDLLGNYFTLPVKFYLTDVQSFNTFAKGS
ncbi:hypothetical protein PQO03_09130 [Lentisphaera profundi]|uniref:Type II secretion system protein GspE N-terminal domain-containing protein n=1 Tax=Lentisphaera profundi TaxID=1658616 RepID=A0ABY7VUU5_9BACT|nr:hypothetical protein [Lentisphaera profundi]WDE95878.1 hypothetical protein PQO03_09130 [Lentisphaera profundi]